MNRELVPDFEPYFGCRPFTPPPVGAKGCTRCSGTAPRGSRRYCAECDAVAPEFDSILGRGLTKAIATDEPGRNLAAARGLEIRTSRKTSLARGRSTLTRAERDDLVREFGSAAKAWLASICQPAGEGPANEPETDELSTQERQRVA